MERHLSRVQERELGDYRLTQGKTGCNALLPAEDERDQRQAGAGVEGEWHSEHLSLKNFFERPFRPFPICKTIARSQPDPQNRARCPVHREEVDFLQLI